ncbi:MAG: macro domain-containing protein [Phycisphaerales bacterium]
MDAIVNAWNRNVIPWWLLAPQGVSRAIKRAAGYAPFRELARAGVIPLGGAVLTGSGRLPHRGIIHVAGINLAWRATDTSVKRSVHNALAVARDAGFASVAFPLIGSGTGGQRRDRVERIMREAIDAAAFSGRVVIVRHAPGADA